MSGAFEPSAGQWIDGAPMNNKDSKNLGQYLGLALMLPIATFVGYGMGYGLDKLFGTHFLYLIFMVIGTAAGIVQVIRDLS